MRPLSTHTPRPIRALRCVRIPVGLALAIALGVSTARAQDPLVPERFAFSPEATYDAAMPSPADFLGYELGTEFTLWSEVVSYLETLAEASDRVTMSEYGRTHEGRRLYQLVITSAANQARIEEIRTANLSLADPRSTSADQAAELIETQPVIVGLSYNVHGNEPSSTEAAMQVAYRLAAGTDASVRAWLDDAVILIDPGINPDGRDRYVNWYKSVRSHVLSTDARDLEHDEPWPGGRTNHYWFDLNRDWVWLVHPESRSRIAAYQRWLPTVHVDHHEQSFNDNYFTHPGITPRNLLLPDEHERWETLFGRANTDAFDRHGITYATRESFDFYYPGYGSSYPAVMGGIGMLVEQGGHSRGGRAVETDDGYVLTLRQRVFDHYITGLATIETAVENRSDLLGYFRAAFTPATNEGAATAYLFRDDPGRSPWLYDVVDMLLRHGVEIERADAGFNVGDARDYWDATPTRRDFEAGTFIVRTDQPRHLFINTILQRALVLEDTVTYDMASWSAPLAYNLDAYWTESPLAVSGTPLDGPPTALSGVVRPDATYAFAIEWSQRGAPRALTALWEAGYRVRFISREFRQAGREFGRGSLLVLLGRQAEGVADRAGSDMERIAREAGVEIVGLNSGRAAAGIDLGSDYAHSLIDPEVAFLVDSPISSNAAGFIYYLLDRDTGLGLTRLRAEGLGSVNLSDFDVLVVPPAFGLGQVIDSTGVARLRNWVEQGGTLVATRSSARFFSADASGLTRIEATPDPGEEEEEESEEDAAATEPDPDAYLRYEDRERHFGLRRVPGSALRGRLDTSHPLAAGLPDRVFALKFDSEAFQPDEDVVTVGHYDRDEESLVAAGYASDENRAKLAGQAFAVVQSIGTGRVILFADDTQYRMFWVGPARLLQNAVLLGSGM